MPFRACQRHDLRLRRSWLPARAVWLRTPTCFETNPVQGEVERRWAQSVVGHRPTGVEDNVLKHGARVRPWASPEIPGIPVIEANRQARYTVTKSFWRPSM